MKSPSPRSTGLPAGDPPSSPSSPTLFSPSPDSTTTLIAQLSSPTLSLADLAAQHNTTPEALALWMTSPTIRERIEATDSVTAWRTRFVAAGQLTKVVATLSLIIDDFNDRNTRGRATDAASPPSTSDIPHPHSHITEPSPAELLLRLREQEVARRAAALLVRLSNTRPVTRNINTPAHSTSTSPAPTPTPAATNLAPPTPPLSLEDLLALLHQHALTEPTDQESRAELQPTHTPDTLEHTAQPIAPHKTPPTPTPIPNPTPNSPRPIPTANPSTVSSAHSDLSNLSAPSALSALYKPSPQPPPRKTKHPNPQNLLAAATREHWP